MRAVVVYESMYGNSRAIAEAIATGLDEAFDVHVLPVAAIDDAALRDVDLVIAGGPTHVHTMSRARTRAAAAEAAAKPGSGLTLEPDACGVGLREWVDSARPLPVRAGAFDTRVAGPAWLTGRASKRVARRLRRRGARLVAPPESFFVTKANVLRAGELDRARVWAATIAHEVLASAAAS